MVAQSPQAADRRLSHSRYPNLHPRRKLRGLMLPEAMTSSQSKVVRQMRRSV
jgi:hypothetical protein